MKKIVSACLAGIKCCYDGKAQPCKIVMELVKQGKAIPVCPEQLGGLTTPRAAAEKKGDKVISKNGKDVTYQFVRGAKEALKIAQLNNCTEAITKIRSPSCSSGKIYDGTFTGKLIDGDGVFVKILKENNINVITEEELPYE